MGHGRTRLRTDRDNFKRRLPLSERGSNGSKQAGTVELEIGRQEPNVEEVLHPGVDFANFTIASNFSAIVVSRL